MGGDNERDAAAALRAELFGEEGEADLEDDIEDPNAGAAGVDEMPEDDLGDGGGGGGGAGRDRADDDEFLESDEDDWIVNEYDDALGGEDADAQRQQQQRRRRRAQQAEDLYGVDAAALAEANDIFGDVDALLQRYNEGRMERQRVADGEMHALGQEEEEDEDTLLDGVDLEGLDEEEIEDLKESKREERRAQVAARKLQQQLEPGAMARHFMLPADERIRETDVPEREQLHRGRDPKNFDFDACAEWVYTELMKERRGAYDKMAELIDDGVREVEGPPPEWMHIASWAPPDEKGKTIELLRGGHAQLHGGTRGLYEGRKTNKEVKTWRENEDAQEALKKAIRTAVELIYKYHEEVPVLGMYRKEVLGELLALRSVDEPANHIEEEILADGSKNPNYGLLKAADRRVRRWDVLWAVQKLTQKWKSLQRLKEAREKSFNEALTAATTVEERNAVQECLDALETVTSIEALEDLDAKFRLVAPAPEDAVAALSLEGPEGEEGEDGGAAATAAAAAKKDQRGGIPRRARRANAHQIAVKAGLQDAARSLGLSAAQFAENLIGGYQVHVTTDPSVPPMVLAAQFVDPDVPARQTPDLVLRSATLILAAEIAAEPAVRKTVRDFFFEKARLSTLVTPAGAATLTPFHPLGVAKRLHDKRIKDFNSDTYLRVLEAEKAGYIKVKISLKGSDNDALPQMLFLSGSVTPESQAWNELRVQVLKEALHSGLLPALEREAKAKLALDARTVVAMETAKALWETAIAPPIDLRDDEDVEVAEKRIMAVCWGPGTPPTTFAILDPFGNMVDYLHCPQLSGTIPRARMRQGETYNILADPKKGKDALAARKFIENHLPHAIVIGIGHCEAFNLREDIKTILGQILDDNPRALLSLETGGILAIPSPEEVATLWEHSEAAKEQMPSSLPIIRRAVALGRQMLDPLAVLASVCGSTKEILSLPLHPLQSALSNEERMLAVEETMCSAVSQVGVDINLAVSHPWMAAPLEFVPGLGPRKAQALIRAINRNGGVVESRKALYHDLGVLGKTVFHNASPYLRVRASTKAAANLELHPLDSTRVHPESYKLAVQIASSAVQNGDEDIAVESAMAAPNEVENLELDVYDEHLRSQDPKGKKKSTTSLAASAGGDDGADGAEGTGAEGDADMREEAENDGANDIDAYLHSDNEDTMTTPPPVPGPRALRGHTRLATLIDIKFELIAPYGELRPRMPKEEALWADHTLLYLATGQGRESLKRGRKVEAKVRYVGEKMVRVTIPELNNIEAVINSDAVSSSKGPGTDGVDCRNHFRNNDTVIAVITAIDEKTRTLTLSTASKMVGDDVTWEHTYLKDRDIGDEAYMVPTQKEINEEKMLSRGAGARKAKGPRVIRRAIKHPLFQNIQMADAASSLVEGNVPVGTALVRPGKSSRGLYLTMRQPGDKIWHIAIAEKGKPSAGLGLATPISVEPVPGKESEYDDLDEFSFRFVEPVAAAMRALVSHRKWRGGDATLQQLPVSWYELQQQLKAERQQHPVAAAYALAADEQRPGAFYLGYILSSTPKREFFVVLPDGFYFRKKMHKTVDHMIAAFKAKPRGAVDGREDERRQQQQRQQQQAQQQDQGYAQLQAQQYQQYQQQYPGQTYQDPAQYQDYYNAGGGGGYFGATVADPYAQEQQAYQYQQYPQQQPQQGQQPDPYSQGGWR
jgi:transcriptional accessory protein Tex/SPT6